ncbi:MAG TPA: ABC transporter substrate-binding protein [Aliidongia sp.]|nr:ABC transporter substrate-binding protein [Aliidongia sp.]
MLCRTLLSLGFLAMLAIGGQARAADAPAEIKIGHLHASSGRFASISMPAYYGLKLWVDETNKAGGALVKPFNKKIPLKLISYDDQSNPGTATTLIDQLITQDKVDILVSDSGSVLTAVFVPIAREHQMLLFDMTGTGAAFFTKDNPYIALLADPVSTIWPKYIADFLKDDGAKSGIKKVALLYCTNDFTGTQATALRGFLKESGSPIEIVYDQGIPTETSNYSTLINNLANAQPDAVLALGYVGNDIAFLRDLQDSGQKFKFVFTIYSGLETDAVSKAVGAEGLTNIFTYITPAVIPYKADIGLGLEPFRELWHKTYPNEGIEFGYNSVAGYTSGLLVGQALATTDSMAQLDLRKAVFAQSGKLKTIDGAFELDATGAQTGEITPLGQLFPDGKGGMRATVVYPHDLANAQPVYNKP